MMRAFIVMAVPVVLLGACSSQPDLPEARCHAAGGAAMLGQPFTPRNADTARMGAGAVRMQVVPYRGPESQEVDPQRLNIEVDDKGVIQRLRCG